jgi:uncharacterized membrane protein (UPF0127 family)
MPAPMLKNKWLIFAISGPILAALVVVGFLLYERSHQGLRLLTVDGQTIYVSVADTESSRELGLGGRESLVADEGMLFIFPVEGNYPFWMKDMRFAIDMVWIRNDGTILYIQGGVVPATYPESFAPKTGLARYVLELPAGYAIAHNIKVGDKVQI